jgi:diguanylate cyclase
MTTLLIEAAIAVSAASAGAAAGWCLRRSREQKTNASSPEPRTATASLEQEAQNNRQAAKELLSQVHGLTTKVASQVGEHNLRVQAINDQLTSGEMTDLQSINDAVTRLAEANAWMQQQLDSAETKLESQARLIESHVNEARTDALTGIANRRAFDEEMQRCLSSLRLEQRPSCVLMIDVDFFKKFNDAHGHKAGDEVLRHVASSLRQAAGEAGVVCRYGGEEFAVVFPNLQAAAAVPIAEHCRAAIGVQSIASDEKTLNVTASAGLSEFAARDTLETVLERADEALYASKRGGRNCGHLHDGFAFLPFIPVAAPAKAPAAKAATVSAPALVDLTTALSTREALRDDLQRRLAVLRREVSPLSLLVVQVDRLSEWQEKGGEEGQNLALRTVSNVIRAEVREMDHAARFEENSFAIAVHGANLAAAVEVAQRILHSLQPARPNLAGQPTAITLSIGVCEAFTGDDAARLMQRAQLAQNTSVNMGVNQISTHDGQHIRLVEELLESRL